MEFIITQNHNGEFCEVIKVQPYKNNTSAILKLNPSWTNYMTLSHYIRIIVSYDNLIGIALSYDNHIGKIISYDNHIAIIISYDKHSGYNHRYNLAEKLRKFHICPIQFQSLNLNIQTAPVCLNPPIIK